MAKSDTTDTGRSLHELREMPEDEAEWILDDDEYERWEQLHNLDTQREETHEEWAEQERVTAEHVVESDLSDATTEIELYGNDLKVLVNLDSEQREVIDAIDGAYDDEDLGEFDEEDIEKLEGLLAAFFEVMITEWNSTDFDKLDGDERREITEYAVRDWGVRAALRGMFDVLTAVREQDAEVTDKIEKFRGEAGGRSH